MSVPEVITAAEVKVAATERKSLIKTFAARLGLEPDRMMETLKATAFKVRGGEITNEQMAALLVVANHHDLNPFTKEIYAYPDKSGGIVPVIGVDGWLTIINRHPQFNGMDFTESAELITNEGAKPCPAWIECTIHRKDRGHPTVIREYLDEVYKPPFEKEGRKILGPWQTHTKRFLRWKTIIQAGRVAFSFSGIYDEDEASNILAADDAIDVTPREDGEMTRGELGEARRVSPKKLRDTVEGCLAAVAADDGPGLLKIRATVDNEEWLYLWGKMRSYERSGITKLLAEAKAADAGVGLIGWASELIASCVDLKALQVAWCAIEKAYDENGVAEVPADLEVLYLDRRAELGK